MSTTLHDVASHAGVSIKTVSNVVNGLGRVSAATRERVLDSIAQLDYRPNLSARSLRSGRTGVIGLAIPELSLAYFAQLADAVIEEAERRGLVVLIEQTRGGDRARELELLRGPRRQLTDGLIFSPFGMTEDDTALLDIGSPLVLLGERLPDANVDRVTMPNVEAGAAATTSLLRLGRERIAVIGAHLDARHGSAVLRYEGFVEALRAGGVELHDELVVEVDLWHRSNGAKAMRELLSRGVAFDGLFAMNDELALGALRVLQEEGIDVPADVALIGFDNVDEGRFSRPSLSTVDPGRADIARMAVDLLLERIGGTVSDEVAPRELRSPFCVIDRESTGGD
ncbi:LacI family DNA-binding transcriptional regulator [Agromyces subbeticus]|uniref:LacI family DNA-binding transcriptional regulator n=1 Tax=Agromyces subbeticus TaxID=293890 RepID=UPI0003B6E503|nr:LacI family DNA-binding transcriptional regulator [Agromyces subbeticus]